MGLEASDCGRGDRCGANVTSFYRRQQRLGAFGAIGEQRHHGRPILSPIILPWLEKPFGHAWRVQPPQGLDGRRTNAGRVRQQQPAQGFNNLGRTAHRKQLHRPDPIGLRQPFLSRTDDGGSKQLLQALLRLPGNHRLARAGRRLEKGTNHARRRSRPLGAGHPVQKKIHLTRKPLRAHHRRNRLQELPAAWSLNESRILSQACEHLSGTRGQTAQDRCLHPRLIPVPNDDPGQGFVPFWTRPGPQGQGHLATNSHGEIIDQAQEQSLKALGRRIRARHPRLHPFHSMLANAFIPVGQGDCQRACPIQRLQSLE